MNHRPPRKFRPRRAAPRPSCAQPHRGDRALAHGRVEDGVVLGLQAAGYYDVDFKNRSLASPPMGSNDSTGIVRGAVNPANSSSWNSDQLIEE